MKEGFKRVLSIFSPELRDSHWFISFPKCGKTWVNFIISEYYFRKHNLPLNVKGQIEQYSKHNKNVPLVQFKHEDVPFWKTAQELSSNKGKYRKDKVVFLVRDPKDIIVSSYFQKSKRHRLKTKDQLNEKIDKVTKDVYTKSLSDYVYQETGGIDTIIKYFNIWWDHRETPKDFLLVKYEELNLNTVQVMNKILEFLGEQNINQSLLKEVVETMTFKKMHLLEKQNKFNSTNLRPFDVNDPESYKVRRGKVDGYVDYLTEEEIHFLQQKIKDQLNPVYGYHSNELSEKIILEAN